MRSSGEKEIHGHITYRSNHLLRRMLIESSWIAIRYDPALMRAYHEYCKRMEPNKAIIRIARKLITRIQFVLVNKQAYKKLTY
jgi:transposase